MAPPRQPASRRTVPHDAAPDMARLARLSRLLDSQFRLPGLPFRFGLDGLLGLVPVAGDLVTGAMGGYAVILARRHRLPWHVTVRLVFNIAMDMLIGTIPLVGDVFDFVFKAHRRNYRLLQRYLPAPPDAPDVP